jgi:hypothetical protein
MVKLLGHDICQSLREVMKSVGRREPTLGTASVTRKEPAK